MSTYGYDSPAVTWLERDYNLPGRFRRPFSHVTGIYQVKPDHPEKCVCEIFRQWSSSAAKWRAR